MTIGSPVGIPRIWGEPDRVLRQPKGACPRFRLSDTPATTTRSLTPGEMRPFYSQATSTHGGGWTTHTVGDIDSKVTKVHDYYKSYQRLSDQLIWSDRFKSVPLDLLYIEPEDTNTPHYNEL